MIASQSVPPSRASPSVQTTAMSSLREVGVTGGHAIHHPHDLIETRDRVGRHLGVVNLALQPASEQAEAGDPGGMPRGKPVNQAGQQHARLVYVGEAAAWPACARERR
jgi:hypothetical protein